MMKQLFTRLRVITLFSFLYSAFLHAQVVTDERMFSFEESKIPDYITGVNSQLSISDTHYKDGKQHVVLQKAQAEMSVSFVSGEGIAE